MKEEDVIEKAVKYVNSFGYIQWENLKEINYNNKSSTWIVKFSAKQRTSDENYIYKLHLNNISGNISDLQMIE